MLAPTLRRQDIVMPNNLTSHKIAGLAEAIDAHGAQLVYLPPYSPDLNPIEQACAKFKAALRKAAERPAMASGSSSVKPRTAFTRKNSATSSKTPAMQPDRKSL